MSQAGQSPLFAPKFLGHFNYGFEYMKWAEDQDKNDDVTLDNDSMSSIDERTEQATMS